MSTTKIPKLSGIRIPTLNVFFCRAVKHFRVPQGLAQDVTRPDLVHVGPALRYREVDDLHGDGSLQRSRERGRRNPAF